MNKTGEETLTRIVATIVMMITTGAILYLYGCDNELVLVTTLLTGQITYWGTKL